MDHERLSQARLVIPILNVSNLADSFVWFAKLGWAKSWDWCPSGGPPSFGAPHEH